MADESNFDCEIDLDEALAKLEPLAPSSPPPNSDGTQEAQPGGDWDTLAADILRGVDLHNSITPLAMKMLVSGMNDPAAVNSLRALMQQSQAPRDGRFETRFNYIPRAVSSARKKLARPTQSQTGQAERPRNGSAAYSDYGADP
jgi:hypothetical protein